MLNPVLVLHCFDRKSSGGGVDLSLYVVDAGKNIPWEKDGLHIHLLSCVEIIWHIPEVFWREICLTHHIVQSICCASMKFPLTSVKENTSHTGISKQKIFNKKDNGRATKKRRVALHCCDCEGYEEDKGESISNPRIAVRLTGAAAVTKANQR